MVYTKYSTICLRFLSTTDIISKESLTNANRFKSSSQRWLLRQINDNLVKQAKYDHYRCRSAYKLLEMQKRFKLLKPGQAVVDLGCAPGSWTQVAVRETQATQAGRRSVVVGVDLSPVHEIEGATIFSGQDATTEVTQQLLKEALRGRAVDVVLSDMAPSVSGIRSLDHDNIVKLCDAALSFASKMSCRGASLVMKIFDGADTKRVVTDCKELYETVRHVCPQASRKESSELFLVCTNFKGDVKT